MQGTPPRRPGIVARSKRYLISLELTVIAKTMGMPGPYHMWTKNLSESGLLIAASTDLGVPFIPKTIIELIVDPDKKLLPTPLKCMGKIVRVDKYAEDIIVWGVRIIHNDDEDLSNWKNCVSIVSQNATTIIE